MDLPKTETRLKLVSTNGNAGPVSCDVHGQPEDLAFMIVLACQGVPPLKKIIESAVHTMNDKESMATIDHIKQKIKILHVNE
jgi:hypothetical protein